MKKNRIYFICMVGMILSLVSLSGCMTGSNSEFDTGGDKVDSAWLIPKEEVRDGGPGKDGIPALSYPQFINVSEVNFLLSTDLLVGIRIGDTVKLYPHRFLDFHEIVNDRVGDSYYVMSYCPLTGTGMFWEAPEAENRTFGVSGLLYNSNLILYDRQSDSYWSQMLLKSVNGSLKGTEAELIAGIESSWETWKRIYPNAQVMTTSYYNSYDNYPYGNYKTSDSLIFPVSFLDDRMHPKERVHGVIGSQTARIYPVKEFGNQIHVVQESLNGVPLVIAGSFELDFVVSYRSTLSDGTQLTFTALNGALPDIMTDNEGNRWDIFGKCTQGPRSGTQLQATTSYNGYWFAWGTFYLQNSVYSANSN